MKKKLLMITWRDIKSPFAGGAEILTHNILKRLTDTYDITVLSSAFPKAKIYENIDKVQYIRLGSARYNYIGAYNWRIYLSVAKYWFLNIRGKIKYDVVVEQINNVPFLYSLYADRNTIVFIHQLCRENWFRQIPWVLGWIGYLIFEPLYLFLLNGQKVITVSNSTKKHLTEYGFDEKNIHIISEGSTIAPLKNFWKAKKGKGFSLLSYGAIREMKRTDHHIKIFEEARKKIKNLKLVIAGSNGGAYGKYILKLAKNSAFSADIQYFGTTDEVQKKILMQKAHLLIMTSQREGWGIVVTEAASQGTPAVVYDVPGLCDSVMNEVTGVVCKEDIKEAARQIVRIHKNKNLYKKLSYNAWADSKSINFDNSAIDFLQAIDDVALNKAQLINKSKIFRYAK